MRYTVTKLDNGALVLRYEMGYTKIECNSKTGRTIVRNITSDKWIPYQFDEIFGLGEYKKFEANIISQESTPNPGNPHSKTVVLVGDYLPKMARDDIKHEFGDEKNLIGKYFK